MPPAGRMNIDRHQCDCPALRAMLHAWDLNSMARKAETERLPHARCTSRRAPEAEPAWTLHGVGAIRLCGWSRLERAAPGGSWRRETAPLSNHQVRTLAAARQVKELAALAGGRPHHLATHFEAYELEAFVSLLRRAGEGTGI